MQKPRSVTILAYPNLCLFEFSCALEVFAQQRPEFDQPHYDVTICTVDKNPEEQHFVSGLGGLNIATAQSSTLQDLAESNLIVIPGWRGIDVLPSAELVENLTHAYQQGAILASICSGAFLLAHAGLLDGKRATTHWQYINRARGLFPDVDFDEAVLFVEDDRTITSAGSAAGLDMCLHLVREHHGQHVANTYARRLLVPPLREGGQAQFIQPFLPSQTNRFSRLVAQIEENLERHYSVRTMAAMVNLSERHFLRQFKAHFADTPSRWLTRLRLQRACELLETTAWPLKTIAKQTGIGSEESLRHHFRQTLKISPSDYRSTYGASLQP